MKLTFEKQTLFDFYEISDEDDCYKGIVIFTNEGWRFDSDGEELSLCQLKEIIKFMETL